MAQFFWHNLSWQEAVKKLETDAENGLSQDEAFDRQKKFGKNTLPEEKPLSWARIFFDQFRSSLIYILVIADVITLFLKDYTDSIIIFGAIFLNVTIGFFQEHKTSKALQELKKIIKHTAEVLRKGNFIIIDSQELIPGDIVVLSPGDKVPADGRLIESHHLKINEMALTGEWLPAVKKTDAFPRETSLADRDNMVYMGTVVEEGKGKAVITATGSLTEIGRIAQMLKEVEEERTPYQRKIDSFSKILGGIIIFLSFLIFIFGVLEGRDFIEMFTTAVAMAVAAIPEGLPAAVTLVFTFGMREILKKKGLVRKLIAAETLGSTSVICADKTGTLTEGRMKVFETVTPGAKIKFDEFKERHHKDHALLMQIAVLNSQAFIENPDALYPLWLIRGRPTDKALILAGAEVGFKKSVLDQAYVKIDEIPFSSENKFIASLVQAVPKIDGMSKHTKVSLIRDPIIHGTDQAILVSGAPEKILGLSSFLHQDGKDRRLTNQDISELNGELENLTARGLRVVAAGYKKISDHKAEIINLNGEIKDLIFVGFLSLHDPIRERAEIAVRTCRQAGMKPIIVTGDHKLTARAVAEKIGFKISEKNILEGNELEKLSDNDFRKIFQDIQIYARVTPEQKLRIIEAWQNAGEVVAMTGDGVNDAPALKKANIGVALGSGTEVAKEVADLTLLTDNFEIIVVAVEEGRRIIDNIRKIVTYLLTGGFTEVMLISLSIIFHLPLPVLAGQILWKNLVESTPPSMALTFEPKEQDIMSRKPEPAHIPLLTGEMKFLIFVVGLFTNFLLFGIFVWLLNHPDYGLAKLEQIRTVIFAGLAMDSFFFIFSFRNLRRNIWQYNPFSNIYLNITILTVFLLLMTAIYLPFFQTLLKTAPFGFFGWSILFVYALVDIILIEAAKYYFIARHQTE